MEYDIADPPASRTLSVIFGDPEETSPYQAELTGLELAVANAGARAPRATLFFWFFTDNQTVIQNITDQAQAKAGLTI